METNNTDHLSVNHLLALGKRSSIFSGGEDEDTWEVFARLSSGNDFVVAHSGTRKEADAVLRHSLTELTLEGLRFVISEEHPYDGSLYINTLFIESIYVDAHLDQWVLLVEDSRGHAHIIERGDEKQCTAAAAALAHVIEHS